MALPCTSAAGCTGWPQNADCWYCCVQTTYDKTKVVFDELSTQVDKYTASLLSRQCKAENDIGNVQVRQARM